jgi:hypothetical protein
MSLKVLSDYNPGDWLAHLECDSAQTAGHVMQHSTADEDKAVTSSGDEVLILAYDVVASIDKINRVVGVRELETLTTEKCTLFKANGHEIVTDNVSGSPSAGADLMVDGGEWKTATAGNKIWGKLIATDFDGTTGDYKIAVFPSPNTAS